jgi:hypothetical protein
LRRHSNIEELCRLQSVNNYMRSDGDSDEEDRITRMGTFGSNKEIQGDVGGSHRGTVNSNDAAAKNGN